MKCVAVLALLVTTHIPAYAECFMRVRANLSKMGISAEGKDTQKLVVPDSRGQMCTVRYRIVVNNQWRTVEGQGVGKNETAACREAYSTKNAYFLVDIEPQKINSDTQMVCSDLPDIRVRPVHIGEVVWESETDLHINLAERAYFNYKNTQCRFFFERNSMTQNLTTYQGVICKIDRTRNSKWQVIDKF
jgi:hypothetical protein